MTKEEIDQVHIEHRSEAKYWNITMFVVPRLGNSGKVPCYADLVDAAEDVLRKAKGLGKAWYSHNAEVMAWSDNTDRGVLTPNRFRVTLDMITEAMESNADADV